METVDGARALSALHAASHESGGSDEIDLTGLSGALTEPEIGALFQGLVIRPRFAWKSNTDMYVGAGVYHHDGTVKQLVYWDSQLTTTDSVTISSDNYLYIDDSAVVTLGSNLLTASEFIWSTTPPVWSESKHGFYNGDDRCIFANWVGGATNLRPFFHDGGDLFIRDNVASPLAATVISDTWTDVSLLMPNFGDNQQALVNFRPAYVNSTSYLEYRKNGSAVTGNIVNFSSTLTRTGFNARRVTGDVDQKIEVRFTSPSGNQASVDAFGWYFPQGM